MAANIQPIGAVKAEGLYSIPMQNGIEAAGQTFKKGAPLVFSSGKLAECGANPAVIQGFATEAASGTTSDPVGYVPCNPSMMFEFSVDGAAGGGNAPGTGKPSDLTIGATYGITQDGTSKNWYLDSSKSAANQRVRVLEYDTDQASLVNGRVRGKVLLANTSL